MTLPVCVLHTIAPFPLFTTMISEGLAWPDCLACPTPSLRVHKDALLPSVRSRRRHVRDTCELRQSSCDGAVGLEQLGVQTRAEATRVRDLYVAESQLVPRHAGFTSEFSNGRNVVRPRALHKLELWHARGVVFADIRSSLCRLEKQQRSVEVVQRHGLQVRVQQV